MGDFKVIETQEDFDKAIKARLSQKDRELAEKYKDFLSPEDASAMKTDFEKELQEANKKVEEAQEKLSSFDETVSNLTQRAEAAENKLLKNKVAYENKLPIELSERLIGKTEEELKADAEKLSAAIKPQSAGAPPAYTGSQKASAVNKYEAGLMQLAEAFSQQFAN